jgi:hypothetical protein
MGVAAFALFFIPAALFFRIFLEKWLIEEKK